MRTDLEAALAAHRPALLRHCYRMLGSYAEAEDVTQDTLVRAWKAKESYRGDASIERWLYAIATNACIDALERRRRRELPQLERAPARDPSEVDAREPERWISPAPDARLFPDPSEIAESKETVALAFVALLQRIPPRQRAALLMKDVLGWSADEIAGALDLTVPSVRSALHRARAAATVDRPAEAPEPERLRAFVQAWEAHDLDALIALLHEDVTLAMPPYAAWFSGRDAVVAFLRTDRLSAFRRSVGKVVPTRANGLPAAAFFRRLDDGSEVPHSIMVVRYAGGAVREMTTFIGPSHFAGFEFSA